jgi:hypothetical protein
VLADSPNADLPSVFRTLDYAPARIKYIRNPVPRVDEESHYAVGAGCIIGAIMPRGRPIETELRDKIARLLKAGKSQVEIGRLIDRAPGTISHYVRALGIARKEYKTPGPIVNGKRKCAVCRKRKSIGAFPNDRGAECTMCLRVKSETSKEKHRGK